MLGSPYSDLDRPPLNAAALRRALIVPDGLWTNLDVVPETASTNADAAGAARSGEPEGWIRVAEQQTAGRGRLGRSWQSPPRAGIAFSVLLRPGVPVGDWPAAPVTSYGWLPLLAGVALAEAVRRIAELDATLKWPNDLLVGGRKCAGILAEAVPGNGSTEPAAVVLGLGLNTTLREDELPRPDTTSLSLAGASCVDRDPLLRAVLRSLAAWYGRWRAAAGDPGTSGLREAYLFHSATVGRDVRVQLPGGGDLVGRAVDVDADGRLIVDSGGGAGLTGDRVAVAAGDVVHVR